MTYHVVFDISSRIPDGIIGVLALCCLVAVGVLAIRNSGRGVLRRTSWIWLLAAGVLGAVFDMRNLGGSEGLLFALVFGGIALVLAIQAARDEEFVLAARSVRARTVAAIVAPALLAFVGLEGVPQLQAWDLSSRLARGETTAETGVVHDHTNPNRGSETFWIGEHEYSYVDSPNYVGFHQTAANGGPIRDGLQVRITSIGDVIVRLEVIDGH